MYVCVTVALCALFFEVTAIQFWSITYFQQELKVKNRPDSAPAVLPLRLLVSVSQTFSFSVLFVTPCLVCLRRKMPAWRQLGRPLIPIWISAVTVALSRQASRL